jgi:hypothetical protein
MYNKGKCHMKYFKRANIYKNSTGSCLVELGKEKTDFKAKSYNWWTFAKYINGVLVFNSYSYSVTTSAHQHRVRMMLEDLGHKVGLFIEAPKGLDDLGEALKYYKNRIERAIEEGNKPRKQMRTKIKLALEIRSHKYTMGRILEIVGDDLNYLLDIDTYKQLASEAFND